MPTLKDLGRPPTAPADPTSPPAQAGRTSWAGLACDEHGTGEGQSLVFLHGLTFDRRMWDAVLEALPEDNRAIAFDLPGHGGSPALARPGLAAVVDALHDAVLDAGLHAPIVVGHSIGGPLATIYAASHPAAAVVSIEAPIRLEPFAQLLRSLAPQLAGEGFESAWARFQDSWRMDLLSADQNKLLRSGERPSRQLVLAYQSDLIERPLQEVTAWRDEGLDQLRRSGTPYLTLHSNPVDESELAWLTQCLPQAASLVWPVRHHFPHVAHPERLAALLTGIAVAVRPDGPTR
jgi:pimeloyl-ACP methyl ester carboxylesterase